MMRKVIFMGVIAIFAISSCGKHTTNEHEGHDHAIDEQHAANDGHNHIEGEEHNTAATAQSESHGDEIVMSAAQAKAAGVQTAIIQPSAFQQVIKTSGQVQVAQGDESVAVATVAGVVSFNGSVTPGKSVSKGTTLVTISSSNIADGDPVQRAQIAYDIAKKEYERMKALVGNKIVSEREFAQAEQNFENARISYEALASGNTKSGQAIKAPINGYVKNVLVNEGDYVTIGQPLVSVTQNQKLFLRADVSEKYYPYLTTIRSANFQTPYDNRVYELAALNGKLLSTGKAAETNTFYVPVVFEFDNKGDIIPGSFVEIYLLSSPINNALVLPRTALTEEQGLHFVYVKLDDEGYQRREVILGADNGVDVQIVSGIHAGDNVVTKGAYQVRLASASASLPAHSHEH